MSLQLHSLSDADIDRLVYEHTKLNPNQADDTAILAGIRQAIRSILSLAAPQGEPLGYFRPMFFGWGQCAETEAGAVALYTAPAPLVPSGWLHLVAAAVSEDAGYIEHYHGSWNSERTRCTACGATDFEGFVGGAALDHKPDCKWVTKQEAVKALRNMIESIETSKEST